MCKITHAAFEQVGEYIMNTEYCKKSVQELDDLRRHYLGVIEGYKTAGIKLNIARGNPSHEQLALSEGLYSTITQTEQYFTKSGADVRNYGLLDGFDEIKSLMGVILQCPTDQIVVGGSSSLTLMYDYLQSAIQYGVYGSKKPWGKEEKIKFICLVPGYDRHFAITEKLGFELISVDLLDDGPDMDKIEQLVAEDESIKGIWCVPKYSNPTGVVYSAQKVKRLAALKPKAKDFRIMWDNAYAIHYLDMQNPDVIPNILEECAAAGNAHMPVVFCSTSKITLAGAGVSALAASAENIAEIKKRLTVQMISYNKVSMMQHYLFLKDEPGLMAHMAKHAAILKPKFDMVQKVFTKNFEGTAIANWTNPKGGYFVAFNTVDGCAKAVVELCAEIGLVLTAAGGQFTYKKDPNDSLIRIAPSFASLDELENALQVFCDVVKYITLEKLCSANV